MKENPCKSETQTSSKNYEVNSIILDTSVEQSKTGNPSADATWEICKLQKQNEE